MVKKVKDLTLEEIEKICEEQILCADCPLMLSNKHRICLNDDNMIKATLEKELEVEENGK